MFEWNFRYVLFKLIFVIDGSGMSCEIVLTWMPQNLADDKSTLVQVMAWCRQATSHYLSQCWHRSMSPYGITRPQWVNSHGIHCLRQLCSRLPWVRISTTCAISVLRNYRKCICILMSPRIITVCQSTVNQILHFRYLYGSSLQLLVVYVLMHIYIYNLGVFETLLSTKPFSICTSDHRGVLHGQSEAQILVSVP